MAANLQGNPLHSAAWLESLTLDLEDSRQNYTLQFGYNIDDRPDGLCQLSVILELYSVFSGEWYRETLWTNSSGSWDIPPINIPLHFESTKLYKSFFQIIFEGKNSPGRYCYSIEIDDIVITPSIMTSSTTSTTTQAPATSESSTPPRGSSSDKKKLETDVIVAIICGTALLVLVFVVTVIVVVAWRGRRGELTISLTPENTTNTEGLHSRVNPVFAHDPEQQTGTSTGHATLGSSTENPESPDYVNVQTFRLSHDYVNTPPTWPSSSGSVPGISSTQDSPVRLENYTSLTDRRSVHIYTDLGPQGTSHQARRTGFSGQNLHRSIPEAATGEEDKDDMPDYLDLL
ncbi:hypothetical protein BaRGS_00035518 [Batillaria attramentaria]|uniref:Uncharacterized protein n=1 Tax=Batillaria attramentaria TaxID=370345 RepID=A0ABD0JEA8_9CAEN